MEEEFMSGWVRTIILAGFASLVLAVPSNASAQVRVAVGVGGPIVPAAVVVAPRRILPPYRYYYGPSPYAYPPPYYVPYAYGYPFYGYPYYRGYVGVGVYPYRYLGPRGGAVFRGGFRR
jgi:hypothetical protein